MTRFEVGMYTDRQEADAAFNDVQNGMQALHRIIYCLHTTDEVSDADLAQFVKLEKSYAKAVDAIARAVQAVPVGGPLKKQGREPRDMKLTDTQEDTLRDVARVSVSEHGGWQYAFPYGWGTLKSLIKRNLLEVRLMSGSIEFSRQVRMTDAGRVWLVEHDHH